jgi:hypothetical protein
VSSAFLYSDRSLGWKCLNSTGSLIGIFGSGFCLLFQPKLPRPVPPVSQPRAKLRSANSPRFLTHSLPDSPCTRSWFAKTFAKTASRSASLPSRLRLPVCYLSGMEEPHVHGVFGLVGHVGAAILHPPNARIRVDPAFPLFVRGAFLRLAIQPRKIFRSRCLPTRCLGQAGKKLLIALAEVTSNNGAQELVMNLRWRQRQRPASATSDP